LQKIFSSISDGEETVSLTEKTAEYHSFSARANFVAQQMISIDGTVRHVELGGDSITAMG
jgi:hypothetical protein